MQNHQLWIESLRVGDTVVMNRKFTLPVTAVTPKMIAFGSNNKQLKKNISDYDVSELTLEFLHRIELKNKKNKLLALARKLDNSNVIVELSELDIDMLILAIGAALEN